MPEKTWFKYPVNPDTLYFAMNRFKIISPGNSDAILCVSFKSSLHVSTEPPLSSVSDTDSSDLPKKAVSIYRLHPYYLAKRTTIRFDLKAQIIQAVALYNEGVIRPFIALDVSDFSASDNFGFNMLAFQQTVPSRAVECDYLASLGAKTELSQKISYLMFYFRSDNAFVIPSGNGWHVIKNICDFSFPLKIAARTLDPNGIEGNKKYNLFGPETTQSSIHRHHKAIDEIAKGAQIKMFSTSFLETSSLRQLACFASKDPSIIDVGLRYLRPHSKILFQDIPQLLAHFSGIILKEPTYLSLTNRRLSAKVESDHEAFDSLMRTRVCDKEKIETLNGALSTLLAQFIESKFDMQSVNLVISPEQEVSYFNSAQYRLSTPLGSYDFTHKPLLSDILRIFKTKDFDTSLFNWINDVSIHFSNSGITNRVSIYHALRGEVVCDGCQYYLINGQYFTADELHLEIKFGQMLSRCLIGQEEPNQLEDWPIAMTEGPYNESFLEQAYTSLSGVGFLAGDRILVKGCELFDILKVTPTTIYLYAVKEGLNGSAARAVCGQIREAMTWFQHNREELLNILWDRMTSGSAEDSEDESYRQVVKAKVEPLGKDHFLSLFNKRIVFVAAMAQKHSVATIKGARQHVLPAPKSFSACINGLAQNSVNNFYDALVHWIVNDSGIDGFSAAQIRTGVIEGNESLKSNRQSMSTQLRVKQVAFAESYVSELDESEENKILIKAQIIMKLKEDSFFLAGTRKQILRSREQVETFFNKLMKSLKPSPVASNNLKLELLALEETLRDAGFGFGICQIERTINEKVIPRSLPLLDIKSEDCKR
jgi:hypothetical protein